MTVEFLQIALLMHRLTGLDCKNGTQLQDMGRTEIMKYKPLPLLPLLGIQIPCTF